ncbi:hypothetical protein CH379_016065 [Leptospira ellisii]|uniref:FunZ protein n=1 Tax=Leptospira ellisii TaxID=2023197 RepID=A0A2N0BA51_9LEPT|nr:hypothetical protein [Leptospira ellisii]MDV6237148.1 hypothetical protein [Leptospira ellisii]PJZ93440.1 hypothetical protein CH379_07825 [Leptospira ellisii]PKA06310.1 hypothetical protein CH375_00285 [Leptospira ellisii]
MKSLKDIDSFGSTDADHDEYLLESFEDHEAYISILERKKYLIVGRKGAGKTAIFKKIITTKSSDYFSYGHTFSDYPWHYHDKQARVGIPDFDKFTHSWKYLIYLTISKIILNHDQSLPYNEECFLEMGKIERFVVDSYGTRDPDITQIFTPSKRLKIKPTFEIDWKLLKASVEAENVPIEDLPVIIQDINKSLSDSIFKVLNPANRYIICFDQLDLGFNPKDSEYSNRLIGLLLAAKDINNTAKSFKKNLFITILLRDDIYNSLQFEDKNKITENYLSAIEWDTARTNNTLKSLMEKRFNLILGENKENITWDNVFDSNQEMPGHQNKYQYLRDRTFLRPRDLIKFCNSALSAHKARLVDPKRSDKELFINEDILEARSSYGDYFLREIDDEVHKHLPNYKNYLEIFRSIGVYRFPIAAFNEEYNKRKESLKEVSNSLDILKGLYRFSIIAFYRSGGKGKGGSTYVYKYQNPELDFDEMTQHIEVHPGLMEVLGLKRYETKSLKYDP